jgi:hypothetical protein
MSSKENKKEFHLLVNPRTGSVARKVQPIFIRGHFAVCHTISFDYGKQEWITERSSANLSKCAVFHIPSGVTVVNLLSEDIATEVANCLMRIATLGEFLLEESQVGYRPRISRQLLASPDPDMLKNAFTDSSVIEFLKKVNNGQISSRRELFKIFDEMFPEILIKENEFRKTSSLVHLLPGIR